jgi:CubicO group peptidase (beta-lactamase class C family)
MSFHPFRVALIFVSVLVNSGFVFSQNQTWTHQKRIDEFLNKQIKDPKQPGFSVCIVEKGQIVYEKQAGVANLKKQNPITAETRFETGSVSKMFTAMCILLLEEQGRLKQTDLIHQYIPELPDYGQKITIAQVMSHTSGLKDHIEILGIEGSIVGDKYLTFEAMIVYQNKWPVLTFLPGSDFQYCNDGYMMLALIVERVSGVSLERFAQENIFDPLGMKHSIFCWEQERGLPDQTGAYWFDSGKKKFKSAKPILSALGGVGVFTTLRDFALWDQNFYHNALGKKSPELLRKMETAYQLSNGLSSTYGGGLFMKTHEGVPVVEHAGGWNNFMMQYRRIPIKETSIIICCNSTGFYDPFAWCDSISNMVLEKSLRALPVPANYQGLNLDLHLFAGKFLSDFNKMRELAVDSTGLFVRLGSGANATKMYLHFIEKKNDSTFVFADAYNFPVHVVLKNGIAQTFSWAGGDYFAVTRYYKRVVPMTSNPRVWKGTYESKQFKRKIKIKYNKRKNEMKIKPVFFLSYVLEPIAAGVYRVKDDTIIIRFEEGQLTIGNTWITDIALQKK